jgi:hypothetical protein
MPDIINAYKKQEAVSKVRHPALEVGSPVSFRGLRVKPTMTNTPQEAFETVPFPEKT